ncbi:MAG TPA: DUF885 domain-containing protein [Bryobacteraceae bacterium]
MRLFWILLAVVVANPAPSPKQQLDDLLHEEWEFELRTQPESATIYGDNRYNDKLTDYSIGAIQANYRKTKDFLRRFEALNVSSLPEQDQLSKELMIRNLRRSIENVDLKLYEMPIDQFNGLHLQYAQLVSIFPFATVKDYENYLARLHQFPQMFDQIIALGEAGEHDGLMPPKFLLEKVVTQADAIAASGGPFLAPVKKFPESISAADQKRLRAAVEKTIREEVQPAYRKFSKFVKDNYAPKGRTHEGIWSLPNGDALYRYLVKQSTTTSLTPDQIHTLGWQQVRSIEAEMTQLAKRQGYADLKSFQAAVRRDPRNHATSREQILDAYRKYTDEMYGKVGQLFGRQPKARLTIVPVEGFREKEAADAEYWVGSPDGKRRGRVVVNTGDYAHRSLTEVESTAYHEGVPGHHFQLSIAQELPSLPPFRQHANYTAYIEGWGLYAERLGKEVGLYQDPISDYGRLSGEMLRAIRLVVDTGVHAKHWTRQQMVDFFHEHSTEDEPSIQAEVDRYIAMPGQALAYKIGQLKIIELRERAKKQLGAKFDINAFHDEVLDAGALPLDVLEQRVDGWIRSQKLESSHPAS